ncbi:MAG: nucleotidyltransferase family protein [Chlamydiae bacterium]|nr:nucleotidyltransferase family protein [Chlamydiota bacterium]MBI3278010.1 nucleotidyltransferase family protein [Chlamydiota bacterium]
MIPNRVEEELLISCTPIKITPEKMKRIETLLHGKIDWNYFLQILFQHRLTSRVYQSFKKNFISDVPPPILAELYENVQIEARRALSMVRELIGLLNLFKEQNISSIPYKGPVLAMALYGDVLLRPYMDLDILIRKEDVSKARTILESQGYKPRLHLNLQQQKWLLQYDCEETFSKEGLHVDLHWEIDLPHLSFSKLNDQNLWENLKEMDFGGKTIHVFSPENLLLILCFHGAKHAWSRLHWICDLASLIHQHPQMNWEAVVKRTTTLKGERMLSIGLGLALDLYALHLPIEVIQKIKTNSHVMFLITKIRKRLFQKRKSWPRLGNELIYLRIMEGVGNRLRHSLRHVRPTPAEWMMIPLPEFLYLLYYLVRPIRLITKHIYRFFYKPPNLDLSLFVPTSPFAVDRMLKLAQVVPQDVVYDLGCGEGRMVVMAAKKYGVRGIGIDKDPKRIREAKNNARREGVEHLVKFVKQDAKIADVSSATLLMLNLPSTAYPKLKPLFEELKPGTRIVTRTLYINHLSPLKTETFKDHEKFTHVIYLYQVPEKKVDLAF